MKEGLVDRSRFDLGSFQQFLPNRLESVVQKKLRFLHGRNENGENPNSLFASAIFQNLGAIYVIHIFC